MQQRERAIFKKGSTTFFMSSLFFPADVQEDVFDLYSFVRVADDYVDQVPADTESFEQLKQSWEDALINPEFDIARLDTDDINTRVIKNMLRVARKHHFDLVWIDSFLEAMQSDLIHKEYETIDDTLHYVHGSAEVVGLMMAAIMQLDEEAFTAAKLQGRAMQIINFIRDINEDNQLGRQYFPASELKQFNLTNVTQATAHAQPNDFNDFIQFQISRYENWQAEASIGYKYIPRRFRIPIQTASDMYNWTARQIHKNPQLIFEKKIKPSKPRIIAKALTNIL